MGEVSGWREAGGWRGGSGLRVGGGYLGAVGCIAGNFHFCFWNQTECKTKRQFSVRKLLKIYDSVRMPDESHTDKSPRTYILFILLLTLCSEVKNISF